MQTETTLATAAPADAKRAQILDLLESFIRSRPGLEFGNYGDVSAYRAESRAITKDRDQALTLLRYVRWTSIDGAALRAAFRDAYSGRLSLGWRAFGALKWQQCRDLPADHDYSGGQFALDYCAGQYYPTEYRRAACAVLASATWTYWRDGCMPEPVSYRVEPWGVKDANNRDRFPVRSAAEECLARNGGPSYGHVAVLYSFSGKWMPAGDYLRAKARAEFGAAIARRWFN